LVVYIICINDARSNKYHVYKADTVEIDLQYVVLLKTFERQMLETSSSIIIFLIKL
jgi:hypothetical protein